MTTPEPFSAELVPFHVVDRLPGIPTPGDVGRLIIEQFENAVLRERQDRLTRGVTGQQMVWPMVRSVQSFQSLMGDYSGAFNRAAKAAQDVLEEELFEVIPEQDGIPLSDLKVPASGSMITIKAKTEGKHHIDHDQVLGALAEYVSAQWAADPDSPAPADAPEEFAIAVAGRVLDMMGAATLKVSHVRKLAEQLGHVGADSLSAVVSDSIRKTTIYKGVTVDRKAG